MAQNTLVIEYGDELLSRLGMSRDVFSSEAKFLLAAKLYELGRLSSGEAAQFVGKTRVEFLFDLESLNIPMSNLRTADIEADLEFALDE